MAALDFPASPTVGQIYTANSLSWQWDGVSWRSIATITYLTVSAAASTYQPLDADLTAIAALTGTSGLLKKTAADTWALDTTAYLSGTVAVASGGTGATTAAGARTNLGATSVGANMFTLTNPGAVTFPRFNADNTVSALDAATFRTAIGAGTSSTTGTVTSVGGTGTVSGLTLTGTVTTSGNLTLGGTLAVTPSNFASQTANTFLAAPNGVAGVPTFRAIAAADVPTLNQNTTGSAATLTTGRTIGMTGDVTWTSASFNGSANVTGTATLAVSGVTAGTYASPASVTVDAKGRVTSITAGTSGGITISDDTTTNATRYLVFEDVTSGTSTTMQVSSTKLTFNPSTGALTATSHVSSSDESFKTNWRPLPLDILERLAKVKHGTYDRTDTDVPVTQDGVSAQSLRAVMPSSVVEGEDGKLSVNYGNAALVAAIKLAERVLILEAQLAKLLDI